MFTNNKTFVPISFTQYDIKIRQFETVFYFHQQGDSKYTEIRVESRLSFLLRQNLLAKPFVSLVITKLYQKLIRNVPTMHQQCIRKGKENVAKMKQKCIRIRTGDAIITFLRVLP